MPEDAVFAEYPEPMLRISPDTFDRMARYITTELGIKMPHSKITMIQSRLLRRVRALGLKTIDEYCDRLFSSEDSKSELVHFINAVTTNKTDFFREPTHFNYLTETALPELERAEHGFAPRRINVWSAACSSGEEPYTLAIVLSEYAAAHPGFDFAILATDVSTRVMQMAKEGIYTTEQLSPVPKELRRKYFLRGKGEDESLVRINPALRRRVSFHELNFMDSEYEVREMFDVIFCRNVLIYFERPTQEAVIGKVCGKLNTGGYLFVSHSESLSGLDLPLDSVGPSCFRKRGER